MPFAVMTVALDCGSLSPTRSNQIRQANAHRIFVPGLVSVVDDRDLPGAALD